MDRLLSVKDLQERYQCGAATARRYIREMETASEKLRAVVNSMEWVAEFSDFCEKKAEQFETEYRIMQEEIKKLRAEACEIEDQMRKAV